MRSFENGRRRRRVLRGHRLAVRDRVSLVGIPAIIGTVVSLSAGQQPQVKVVWTEHTSSWVEVSSLEFRGRKRTPCALPVSGHGNY